MSGMSTEVTNTMADETGPIDGAVRGLATVAMLKANFDSGQDHIDMFEPFVLDGVASLPRSDSSAVDVQKAISTRHGLDLPLDSLRLVLGRLVTAGYLQRTGGRYFRTKKEIATTDVLEGRRRAEERQDVLAKGLLLFANERGLKTKSTIEAKGWILKFLEDNHVALTSDPSKCISGGPSDDRRATITAQYLLSIAQGDGDEAQILKEMLEGFVLQNTLLLNEFPDGVSTFSDLAVFADTGVILSALGLEGPASETATTELIRLLSDTGANLNVFQETIEEVRSILTAVENKFATQTGRANLIPSNLTRHLVNVGARPSDIHAKASTLEIELRQLGFNIRDFPEHDPRFTMSEDLLGKMLAGSGSETEARVVHDVSSIGGVITYRRGKTSKSFDDARAVFLTTNVPTFRTVTSWYAKDGGKGRPPIVLQVELSNLAWLKKPGSASNLKLHELVALCTSALCPEPETWRLFVEHLQKLEKSGEVTSQEAAAIIANGFTQQVVVEKGLDLDSDASDVLEVIERVKEEFRGEGAAARQELGRIQKRSRRRAHFIGEFTAWFLTGGIGLLAAIGALMTFLDLVGAEILSAALTIPSIIVLTFLSVFGIFWGFHLRSYQRKVSAFISGRAESWLIGESVEHRR